MTRWTLGRRLPRMGIRVIATKIENYLSPTIAFDVRSPKKKIVLVKSWKSHWLPDDGGGSEITERYNWKVTITTAIVAG